MQHAKGTEKRGVVFTKNLKRGVVFTKNLKLLFRGAGAIAVQPLLTTTDTE